MTLIVPPKSNGILSVYYRFCFRYTSSLAQPMTLRMQPRPSRAASLPIAWWWRHSILQKCSIGKNFIDTLARILCSFSNYRIQQSTKPEQRSFWCCCLGVTVKFIFCLLNFLDSSWFLFKQTQANMKIGLGFWGGSRCILAKNSFCCCNRPTTLSLASFRNL